jgi:hypothetical protein
LVGRYERAQFEANFSTPCQNGIIYMSFRLCVEKLAFLGKLPIPFTLMTATFPEILEKVFLRNSE